MAVEFIRPMAGPNQSSDESLVAILQQVPPSPAAGEAFTTVYERYASDLTGYVMGNLVRTQRVQPSDAEDLLQTTFTKAWAGIDRYDPEEGSLRNWLMTIAHHAAVDMYRHQKFRPVDFVDPSEVPEYDAPGEVDSMFESAAFYETLRTLERGGLRHGDMQLLFDNMSGITNAETAKRDGVPLSTAKSRMRFAREKAVAILAEAA